MKLPKAPMLWLCPQSLTVVLMIKYFIWKFDVTIIRSFVCTVFSVNARPIVRPLFRNASAATFFFFTLNLSHLKPNSIVLSRASAETWSYNLELTSGEAMLPPAGQHQPMQPLTLVCSRIWLKSQMFLCTLLRRKYDHNLLQYVFLRRSVTQACRIFLHRANMEITSNERWSQQPTQLCSDLCLSFDLWSAKQTLMMAAAHWISLRHEHTALKKIQENLLPSLWALYLLPLKCVLFIVYIDIHNVKVHDSPSGPVCLKAAMP